ncbi:hypothetical protein DFJ58DRAFT_405543 [Suillus subalutaceus]|uniref:uncharacterized protein n=1 Tax=Suillus subalutaceus TaxID=48586 RepID=UPI001B85FD02|nr:uncharacterized protein DFJ58DRAFT_405543 [Suillus subalutaceus]KAG1872913.1 hypothetical protein DFJ58DRAFT_405543 [Suillus subalutaceus]
MRGVGGRTYAESSHTPPQLVDRHYRMPIPNFRMSADNSIGHYCLLISSTCSATSSSFGTTSVGPGSDHDDHLRPAKRPDADTTNPWPGFCSLAVPVTIREDVQKLAALIRLLVTVGLDEEKAESDHSPGSNFENELVTVTSTEQYTLPNLPETCHGSPQDASCTCRISPLVATGTKCVKGYPIPCRLRGFSLAFARRFNLLARNSYA